MIAPQKNSSGDYLSGALKITIIYLFFGLVWIMLSDSVVLYLAGSKQVAIAIGMVKGYLYVLLTALLIYFLIKKDRKQLYLNNVKLENYAHLYAALSQINQAIVRTSDKNTLFEEICKIAVEFGKLKFVWIGLIEDKSRKVTPSYSAGEDTGYLSFLRKENDTLLIGNNTTGTALGEGLLSVCADISTESSKEMWCSEALSRGYCSSASIPLFENDLLIGCLMLYADRPGFFGAEERLLLEEIGRDISFALNILKATKQRAENEEVLKQSEKSYRGLFESVSDAIYVLNKNGEFLDVNQGALRLYGYTKDELLFKTPQFVSADGMNDLEHTFRLLQDAYNGKPALFEFWGKRKDGTVFPKEIKLNKGDYFGEPVIIAIARDISAVKEQEKIAAESLARITAQRELITKLALNPCSEDDDILLAARLICESGIQIFQANEINVCFYKQDGFTVSAISCFTGQKENQATVHEYKSMGKLHAFSFLHTAMYLTSDSTPAGFPSEYLPENGKHKATKAVLIAAIKNSDQNNGLIRVGYSEEWHNWNHSEIDFACQLASHLGTLIERSYRQSAEHALVATEKKYHEVFNATTDAIIIYHVETGAIIDCNAGTAKMFGYTIDELLSLSILDLSAYDNHPPMLHRLNEIRNTNEKDETVFEWPGKRKDGSTFWLEIKINYTEIGGKMNSLAVLRDIDARKKGELSLMDSEAKLTAMVSTIDEIVFEFDEFGTYLNIWVINEGLLARPKVEMIGKKLNEIVSGKIADEFMRCITSVLETNTSAVIEYEIEVIAGKMWFWGRFTPIPSTTGKRTVSFIARDISERKHSEECLIESESLLRKAQEVASLGHFIYNFATNTWKSSEVFDAICEIDDSFRHDSASWEEFFFEEDRKFIREKFLDVVYLQHQVLELEFRIRKIKSHNLCWLHGLCEVVLSPDGALISIIGTVQDITERKFVDKALKESETRFRELTDLLPQTIFETDVSGNLTYVNRIAYQTFGFSESDFKAGFNFIRAIIPEEHEKARENFRKVLHGKNIGLNEFRGLKKDGTVFPIVIQSIPIVAAGQTIGLRGIIIDISERKQSESLLREREETLRTLIDAVPDIVCFKDAGGRWIKANVFDIKFFGLEGVDYVGKTDAELAPFSDFYRDTFLSIAENDEKTWQAGAPTRGDEVIALPDGMNKVFDIIKIPMFYPDGSRKGLIVVGRDITDRKKIEEELIFAKDKAEELNRLKSNFLANMSHELRTPLIGILGFSEILSGILTNPEEQKMASTIHLAGERLLTTLNMLLNLAKIEANRQELKIVTIQLDETIERIVKLFEITAANRNLKLEYTRGPSPVFIRGDQLLVDSILNNLISNAIKYTDQGGVTVSLTEIIKSGRMYAQVTVTDTGIGISEEQHDLVFDAFRQASEGYGRAFEGTGLGLTLTRRYVFMLGGNLTLESKSGVGSTFTVHLPLFFPEGQTNAAVAELSEPAVVRYFSKSVLLVDDDSTVYDLLKYLVPDSSKLHYAATSKEALALLEANRYGMIFLDINLREKVTGLDILKIVRNDKRHIDTPVTALTAYAMEGDRENFLLGGCDFYLAKPFKTKEIADLLSKIL
ncbi:MAG: PAS domain S-box protein [Ignavibacteriales bacterium]|nr:PAS domain S-box protein [Ignavibacteriales bacterium]